MILFSYLALGITTVATIAVMWVSAKWTTALPEVAMCLLAAVWCAVSALNGRKLSHSWVLVPLGGVALLAVVQISTGITVYSWPTRMAALYWMGNLATFFVALQLFADRKVRSRYLDALVAFGVFLCLLSSVQAMTSFSTVYWAFETKLSYGPVFGPFLYVNQFAAFVELLLPITIYNALTRQKGRFWMVLATAILAGSVLYSGSRGGAILVLIELIAVPAMVVSRSETTRRQLLRGGAVLAVAMLWLALVAGPDKLIQKATTGGLFEGRREFNQSSLAMIKARPLQGFGLGNWATAYPGYASFDDGMYANQAHNDWAQWAVEGGIPLLLLMLSVAVWAIPRAVRSGWGLGVAIIFIHCLWDYPIQRTGVAIVFFTMMAAIAPYGRARPNPAPLKPGDHSVST